MKAMIFAAGIGSRLKEFTRETPKCLMDVGGITMLDRVVGQLKRAGVTSVTINVHHHAEKVISFVESRRRFDIDVNFSHEQELLDTGGGLKKVRSFFEGEKVFLIHNADVYCTVDLNSLVQRHLERNALATLLVMQRRSDRGLFFNHDYQLVGWTADDSSTPNKAKQLAFCGISAASGELFQSMGDEQTFSIIKTFLSAARTTQRVWGHILEEGAEWVDIGTPEQLLNLRHRLSTP